MPSKSLGTLSLLIFVFIVASGIYFFVVPDYNSQLISAQTSGIISISKAFLLDKHQNIVTDIYDTVKTQDNNFLTINNDEYIRVTFNQILDNTKDNTIYAKPTDLAKPASIEVYPVYTDKNGNVTEGSKVAVFENINREDTYKVLLTNLQTPTDQFDLKVKGSVDIDYVVDPFVCGTSTIQDGDGKVYGTVLIGTQCWMATNLEYDGNPSTTGCTAATWVNNTDVGWCGYYTSGPFTDEGLLYQWSAAMQANLCPTGWHVPSDEEYMTLEEYLGMCSGTGAGCSGVAFGQTRGTTEGDEMQKAGNCRGRTPCGTSGYNAISPGYRIGAGSFTGRASYENLWTSSAYQPTNMIFRQLYNFDSHVGRSYTAKYMAMSVRCLRSTNTAPTGTFNSATQNADGTGNVSASVTVSDAENDNPKAKVEYTTDATCATGTAKATLIGTPTATVTPAPDLTQANAYQLGTTTPILTSSANTVTFVWDSKTDLPNATGATNYYLCLTANDGTVDQTSIGASSAIAVNNTVPNASSTLTWSGTSPSNSTSITASWTKSNSSDLANQKIQFYSDDTCTITSGSLIDLASNSVQVRAFTGSDVTTYAYKITSIDTAGNETVSSCSSAMSIVLNTAPTLTSVATSPNPIKGGSTITITPTGQGDADTNALNYYCAEVTAPTSSNTLCSEANASYSSPYTTATCTYAVATGDTTRTVYCRTYDGTAYSTERTTTYTVDSTAPTVSEVAPLTNPTDDTTPNYIFSSTEAGTITYGGSCSSSTTTAVSGNNTITFNTLTPATYSNCTITVTDAVGNASSALTLTSFTISGARVGSGNSLYNPSRPVPPLVLLPSPANQSSARSSALNYVSQTLIQLRKVLLVVPESAADNQSILQAYQKIIDLLFDILHSISK